MLQVPAKNTSTSDIAKTLEVHAKKTSSDTAKTLQVPAKNISTSDTAQTLQVPEKIYFIWHSPNTPSASTKILQHLTQRKHSKCLQKTLQCLTQPILPVPASTPQHLTQLILSVPAKSTSDTAHIAHACKVNIWHSSYWQCPQSQRLTQLMLTVPAKSTSDTAHTDSACKVNIWHSSYCPCLQS